MCQEFEELEDEKLGAQRRLMHLHNGAEPPVQFGVQSLVRGSPEGRLLRFSTRQCLPLPLVVEEPLGARWLNGPHQKFMDSHLRTGHLPAQLSWEQADQGRDALNEFRPRREPAVAVQLIHYLLRFLFLHILFLDMLQ